jgi:hypothetical protein
MDRRSFLASAGAVMAATTVLDIGAEAAHATGNGIRPVVDWEWVGGFVGPGVDVLRAPRLVAYPGGLAIADANRQIRLDPARLGYLRRHMVTVLADPASTRRRPGAPVIADAPTTRFVVRSGGRLYTANVDALNEYQPEHAYPARLYRLSDHLGAVRHRVLSTGVAYRPAAIRLVAIVESGPASSTVVAWPYGVPMPAIAPGSIFGLVALRGPTALTAVRAIPHRDLWPVFRSPDGRLLRVAWRYLLPHE